MIEELEELEELTEEITDIIRDRVSMEVEGGLVDNGIGHYEYWGATGIHHDWQFELQEDTVRIFIEKAEALPVEFTFFKVFSDDEERELKAYLTEVIRKDDKIIAEYDIELI